ncbi:serine acetyltransferase [bacterium BMS3Abin01]|nr:serine acetyltransferase [bacterium BMS3Abin01]HDZ59841.1 serine O-acetyltransferase [Actinomycetota bacterium]
MGFLKKAGAALTATAVSYLWLNRQGELGRTLESIKRDVSAIQERDPAAANMVEALTCYAGLHAVIMHRVAHHLYRQGLPVMPRIISQINRFFTGIEIHPAARIGEGFFIDHGAGVVVGETTEVGDNVTIYQGVTLGGTGKETGKRHPTLKDNVTIGAGAKVLGSVTVGQNAKIGAGTIVIQNVPDNSTVVGNPGRPVRERGRKVGAADVDWTHLPDPVADAMQSLVRRVVEMENEFKAAFPEKREEIEKAQKDGERELDKIFEYYHGTGI